MTLPFPPREEIARLTARMLLEIKAVHFNAAEPFTYSSGLKGPTYIDCRKLISYPRIRATLMDFLAATVLRDAGFDAFDNIAGGKKTSPDEFKIVSHSPLTMPPNAPNSTTGMGASTPRPSMMGLSTLSIRPPTNSSTE